VLTLDQDLYGSGWEIGAYVTLASVNPLELFNGTPGGAVSFTGTVQIRVESDRNCTVKRGANNTDPGDYASCTATLTSTGGTIHTETLDVTASTAYHYYIYAIDSNDVESDVIEIEFTTGASTTVQSSKNISISGGGNITMTFTGAGNITMTVNPASETSQSFINALMEHAYDDGYYLETSGTHYTVLSSTAPVGSLKTGWDGTQQRSPNFRFLANIPSGATIDEAKITLVSAANTLEGTEFNIYAEDANDSDRIWDADDFETAREDLTTATVNLDMEAVSEGESITVDVTAIAQEVVTDNSGCVHIQYFFNSVSDEVEGGNPFYPWAYEKGSGYAKHTIKYH
jgi:hypothetical protein